MALQQCALAMARGRILLQIFNLKSELLLQNFNKISCLTILQSYLTSFFKNRNTTLVTLQPFQLLYLLCSLTALLFNCFSGLSG